MTRVDATHAAKTMPTGMLRRGARYYVRRRVPLDLIDAYGKKEILKALGTSDYAEAKKRLAIQWVTLDKEFDDRRAALARCDVVPASEQPIAGALAKYRQQSGAKPRLAIQTILAATDRMDAPTASARLSRDVEPENGLRTLTWDRLVDRWAAERKPTSKTRKDHAAVAELFRALVGTPPNIISRSDVLSFKEKLVERGISSANLKTKLSRLKTLVNYGHDNGLIKERAADGVRVAKAKVKSRVPFDDQSLKQLFSGPIHQDGHRPTLGRGEAAFWLPLIALYTGARLEEIAGLRVDDLMELGFEVDGADQTAWFFRFSPDPAANRALKNDDSERAVPIHPELIRLGLLKYRDELRFSDESQLFPLLTQHKSGKRAHKWGQWFGTYLRTDCQVTDTRKVFHSFRHTLKDAARECGIPEDIQRAIMGHSATDVAGNYGLGFSRRRIVEGMNSIRIPGLPPIKPGA